MIPTISYSGKGKTVQAVRKSVVAKDFGGGAEG